MGQVRENVRHVQFNHYDDQNDDEIAIIAMAEARAILNGERHLNVYIHNVPGIRKSVKQIKNLRRRDNYRQRVNTLLAAMNINFVNQVFASIVCIRGNPLKMLN